MKITLKTYTNVWKFQKKIYAIDKIKLIVPINPEETIYFVISALITILLLRIFSFLNFIPFLIRYGLLPYLFMKFLTKTKLDGKMPHKFLLGYITYKTMPKKYARFQPVTEFKAGSFKTKISYRRPKIINLTQSYLKKGGKQYV